MVMGSALSPSMRLILEPVTSTLSIFCGCCAVALVAMVPMAMPMQACATANGRDFIFMEEPLVGDGTIVLVRVGAQSAGIDSAANAPSYGPACCDILDPACLPTNRPDGP